MSKIKPKFNLCVLELPKDFKILESEAYPKLLNKKFVELSPSQEFGYGWVHPEDMFKSNFDITDIAVTDSLVCGFRFDKKSVPAALIKKLFNEKLKERESELGSKLEKADKQILKEECKELLILKTLPSPKMFQWIWNLEENTIFLDVKSEKTIDDFIDLFFKTFDVAIQRKNYGIPEDNITLFLDWIWKQSHSLEGQWFDKGITLDAEKNTFKFSGPTIEAYLKEIEPLSIGKNVKELCVGCALGSNDYYLTLSSKNLIINVENANKIKYNSMESAILDRVDVCKRVVSKIEKLITDYLN